MSIRPARLSQAIADRLPELMRLAIAEARRGDLPFGCVLADAASGALLGAAANSVWSDPTGHAEVNALRLMVGRGLDASRVVLISTAEPCPMCASAIYWAKVGGIVYGTSASDLMRFGWVQIDISCAEVLARGRPAGTIPLWAGLLAEQTDRLYEQGPASLEFRAGESP